MLRFYCVLLFAAVATGCGSGSDPSTEPDLPTSSPIFQEVTTQAGLNFLQTSEPTDDFPMPQIMGSGIGLLDANSDGLLDVLISPAVSTGSIDDAVATPCPLFLQRPDGGFTDFTKEAGISVRAFGMGVAAADIDNDGDLDVCMTSAAGVSLFLNDGTARFSEITSGSGVSGIRWSTAAAFLDYDRDGWLDLLIVNYVDYFPGSICQDATGRRDYCGPQPFNGTVDRLYRNMGAHGQPGTFQDVTISTGLAAAAGKGLGAICTDFNNDRRMDIYVANDMEPNRLWIQQPDGSFLDEASLRGCAVDLQGRSQASMGTAWSDFDDDGRQDILLTHLRGESNTLYRQIEDGLFIDRTATSGLGPASLNFTGFGVASPDLDLDGRPDLLIANGRVMRAPLLNPLPGTSHWDEYAERNQIFLNAGDGQFSEILPGSDPFVSPIEVTRGLAAGDIDNDGRIDVVINSTNAPIRLFRNVANTTGHWLTLRVMDPANQRDAIGARVRIISGSNTWIREVQPQVSYLSSHDARIHIGLGSAETVDWIEVWWPDHDMMPERFPATEVDRQLTLLRGTGLRQEVTQEALPEQTVP